jgi:hypothetical protein
VPGITGEQQKPVTADLLIPKPKLEPTATITRVYPTADVLPENTLRLYVHFSAPMSKGDVYKHVKLLKEGGKPVVLPFLEIDEELWSPDGKRFTLLFDPGRVKQGLKPREEEGPILEAGKKYTLVIAAAWPDAAGTPLKAAFRKSFSAAPADDAPVDPAKWTLTPPPAGGRTPLVVKLNKAHDHALLHRLVWVADAAGQRIEGETAVTDGEKTWQFTPAAPWPKGPFRLVVDTRLEDPCGNRVGEPFEVDVFKPVQKKIEGKTVERGFEVR